LILYLLFVEKIVKVKIFKRKLIRNVHFFSIKYSTIFYLFKYDIKLSHKNMILYFYKFDNNVINNIYSLWLL